MKILVVDNYDSFTYNLVYLLRRHKYVKALEVIRNDKIGLDEVDKFDKIILSPGPGIPSEAGLMPSIIKEYCHCKSILGVCLGHQAIGEAFGGSLENMDVVLHGIQNEININTSDYLFQGMDVRISVGRYHSWRIQKSSLTERPLEIIATDLSGEIMAVRHQNYDVRGVQFHPESIMTPEGNMIINNWIEN